MLPEVLIYIQIVKKFLKSDNTARNYFLGNTTEDVFFTHLSLKSEENFKEKGEVALTIEQFEEIKREIEKTGTVEKEISGHFFHSPIFGNISLN